MRKRTLVRQVAQLERRLQEEERKMIARIDQAEWEAEALKLRVSLLERTKVTSERIDPVTVGLDVPEEF
jgi:hypothetical protein